MNNKNRSISTGAIVLVILLAVFAIAKVWLQVKAIENTQPYANLYQQRDISVLWQDTANLDHALEMTWYDQSAQRYQQLSLMLDLVYLRLRDNISLYQEDSPVGLLAAQNSLSALIERLDGILRQPSPDPAALATEHGVLRSLLIDLKGLDNQSTQHSVKLLTEQHRNIKAFIGNLGLLIVFISLAALTLIVLILHQSRTIEKLRAAEDRLRLSNKVYSEIDNAILITDPDARIIDMNDALCRNTGYNREELLDHNPRVIASGRHNKAFYQAMWRQILEQGYWRGELWGRRKNGEIYPKLTSISTIYDQQGRTTNYVAIYTDITDIKQTEQTLHKLAHFDELTGLPNRSMFRYRLEQAIKKAQRSEQTLALLFIDLDHFKDINDTLGHDLGDLLLIQAAQRLCLCVRETDTVARLGGDEFTIILEDLTDSSLLERITQNILQRFTEPFQLGIETTYISASIGITFYPADAGDIDELLKHADQAMYAAKNRGRNRFHYFTSSMQEAALVRMSLAKDLRTALSAGQFELLYQPIVELATGRVSKAESLLRWWHPERGLINPSSFIPIAEETGMIIGIGDWVFRTAASQASCWRKAFDADFQISVNTSPVQYRDGQNQLYDWSPYLQALDLSGQAIVVEITEGMLLDASATVTDKLLVFRDAGIQVALDDFGTGYSSLSYLKKFDIDYIKIDQSFVRNLAPDSDDMVLCEAIIVMAHKLGISVIAEGIETDWQRELLLIAGCDFGQGYLFSRPLAVADFEAFMIDKKVMGKGLA